MMTTRTCLLFVLIVISSYWANPCSAVTIGLNGVIGPSGTDANTVKGLGNPVNETGFGSNSGSTTLTAAGSPSPASFNFNTGFSDSQDRTIGSTAGAGRVFSDRKFDSATATALILDTDNDRDFNDETDDAPSDPNTFHFGFGMHSDTYITFDLDVIRANESIAATSFFRLTGEAGAANRIDATRLTSGAILLDGMELAVFDWDSSVGAYDQFDTFDLSLPLSGRYLTFIGLSGLDGTNFADHVGFRDVLLQEVAVPEPSTLSLAAMGLAMAMTRRRRRRSP